MLSITKFLEKHGFIGSENTRAVISGLSASELARTYSEVYEAVHDDWTRCKDDPRAADPGEFRFVASASWRGEYGCDHIDCRLARVSNLARYSALYCERLIVPLRVHPVPAGTAESRLRHELLTITLSLGEIRPVIDSGNIQLVPESLHLCEECSRNFLNQATSVKRASRRLLEESRKHFTASAELVDGPHPMALVKIVGPQDVMEHGQIFTITTEAKVVAELAKTRSSRKTLNFSAAAIKRLKLLEPLFSSLAASCAFDAHYVSSFDAKYLAGLAGEARFLGMVNQDQELMRRSAQLLAHLTHEVPLFSDVSLATLMTLRHENPDAFLRYRYALAGIIKEYVKNRTYVSSSQAKEIYSDVLRPEVLKLSQSLHEQRRSRIKNVAINAAVTGGVVSLGIAGGFFPAALNGLIAAFGAGTVLQGVKDLVTTKNDETLPIRNSEFYFLLRLQQSA